MENKIVIEGTGFRAAPFEPAKKNRFLVELPEELGIPSYVVRSVRGLGYYPGSAYVGHLVLELYSPITPSTNKALYDNIVSKKLEYIDEVKIKYLNAVGDIIETVTLRECKIEGIQFPALDWNDDRPTTTFLELAPSIMEIK